MCGKYTGKKGGDSIESTRNELMKQKLLTCMKTTAYRPMKMHELMEDMEISGDQKKAFQNTLVEMEKEGLVMSTRSQRFGVPEKMGFMTGILKGHWKGYGFVDSIDPELPSAYIPANAMRNAFHLDKVLVRIKESAGEDQKAEGEVVSVLERGVLELPGTFEKSKKFGFVVPDDPRFNSDIFIPGDRAKGVPNGYKVVCRITKWAENRRNPEGKIIEVLGNPEDPETDMMAIIRKHGLNEDFSKSVIKEARSVAQMIPEKELRRRKDLRHMNIVTIDGPDAKDLDDAISVEKLNGDNIRLGVHIADVVHYVRQGSKLDQEAWKRGTSVYLVDRVLPMLPQELSNGICSLNPKEDRLTMSVFMDIDEKGVVVRHDIQETVINTSERLIYDDVSDVIENQDEDLTKRYQHIHADLLLMDKLYLRLRERRAARGSIDFHFSESKVMLDEKGNPIDIRLEERRTANRIIEEFMLVCNETVAEHHYWMKQPFIYRVHEDPDEERMMDLNKFIFNFGYQLKGIGSDMHPKELQQLLAAVEGKKEAPVINTMMLRSLKKAKYTANHGTHFGLAARYYSHFTSPIRRYPDLAIHRIIKQVLKDGAVVDDSERDQLHDQLEKTAAHSSEQERNAEEAERESVDLKKAIYMKQHIGDTFDGLISGITSFGIFVELDNTVEGLIRLSDLDDDYYVYDQQHLTLTGERTKKVFRIGDALTIRVEGVNVGQREIDFTLVTNNSKNG